MQELRQEANDRKKSKSKVGTIYNENVNYSQNIPAFDSSHMPARAKQIKSEVKLSILPDILGAKPAKWNPSVLFDSSKEYVDQAPVEKVHFEIRKGLRDASLPRPSFSKVYVGVDSRNEPSNWNISVQFDSNEHKKRHLMVNERARNNSAQRVREILDGKKYVKPFERQVGILKSVRKGKEEMGEVKAEIMKGILHENPDISREKATAVVHKMVEMRKEKDKQEKFYGIKAESFKPEVRETCKKNVVRKCKHDGVFQYNEYLQKQVWSCCSKEEEHSEGCVVTYKDLDKWQLVSL